MTKTSKERSLAFLYPELLEEWDYKKNPLLNPTAVCAHSGKKAWWTCHKGHSYNTVINDRSNGYGCPYCCGLKVCKDNSLFGLRPDLAKEWNYDKNNNLNPENVTSCSHKKVYWK